MEDETTWIYDLILQIICSPEFRNPIKNFIDENCESFIGEEENSLEQGALHKKFINLVETLLETSIKEFGITDQMFCLAAKKGLEDPKGKKYFEQLIAFTNYMYFKNLLTKRNLHLEELALKEMQSKLESESVSKAKRDEQMQHFEQLAKMKEEKEIEAAIKMSLALEEEKKKLQEIEDEEIKRAIKLSELDAVQKNPIAKSFKNENVNTQQQNIKKDVKPTQPIKEQKNIKVDDNKKVTTDNTPSVGKTANNFIGKPLDNKSQTDFEEEKKKKLKEYREMILKEKKESRDKQLLKTNQDNVLDGQLTEEEKRKFLLRKELANKLKKNNTKFNSES
jgi:hypothetical protein